MSSRQEAVLVINCGSSSLKFALFDEREQRMAEGAVEQIGGDGAAWVRTTSERKERKSSCADHAAALDLALAMLDEQGANQFTAAAHRVVHGGPDHFQPALVDDSLLDDLRKVISLAPLHLPASLAGIEAMKKRQPQLPQVACFDTAFHHSLPEIARTYPLPEKYAQVRRYGFHGLSYEYVVSTLGTPPPARVVIAHLGSGASLCAVKDGSSIDTTMGLTPTGGVMMGTRTGDLDPGALIYLLREGHLGVDELEQLVDRQAGWKAIGGSSDMKALLERFDTDPRARLAVEMFGYAVKKAIGAFIAALGGLELLVLTGGIGERAARVRALACAGLQAFGIELDEQRNRDNQDVISAPASKVQVRVVKTDEELIIARHARRLLED